MHSTCPNRTNHSTFISKGKKKDHVKKTVINSRACASMDFPCLEAQNTHNLFYMQQHIGETGCPKRTKKCQNMSKYVQIFYRMSKYVKIFQNMSKNVKICQNMSKNEINVATPLPHMRKICVDSILSWIVGLI